MLRMIAYGTELNLAHPPRPTDPKIAWEPDWALKVRVKSVAYVDARHAGDGRHGRRDGRRLATGGEGSPAEARRPAEQPKKKKKFGLKDALDAVKDSVVRTEAPSPVSLDLFRVREVA